MLRNNIDFKIFQGEKEIKFDVVEKLFRNEKYKAISVNGQKTSMTTTMGGSDWDIPFAPFREIYSNALDEDDNIVLQKINIVVGEENTTSIFIENTIAIADFFSNFNEYFCDKNPNVLATNSYGTVYPASCELLSKLYFSL